MDNLEERKAKANQEYKKLLKWAIEEENKVYEKLKAAGNLQSGLDSNSKEYKYIYETIDQRTRDIISKYDLPIKLK